MKSSIAKLLIFSLGLCFMPSVSMAQGTGGTKKQHTENVKSQNYRRKIKSGEGGRGINPEVKKHNIDKKSYNVIRYLDEAKVILEGLAASYAKSVRKGEAGFDARVNERLANKQKLLGLLNKAENATADSNLKKTIQDLYKKVSSYVFMIDDKHGQPTSDCMAGVKTYNLKIDQVINQAKALQ